jgi:hypothetical protein
MILFIYLLYYSPTIFCLGFFVHLHIPLYTVHIVPLILGTFALLFAHIFFMR